MAFRGKLDGSALRDRDLVETQLGVLSDVLLARHSLAGLEVDNVEMALDIDFDPVHRTTQDDGFAINLEIDHEAVLGHQWCARIGQMPVCKSADRLVGVNAFACVDPGCGELELVPNGREMRVEHVDVDACLADYVGRQSMHDRAEPLCRRGGTSTMDLAVKKPTERALN